MTTRQRIELTDDTVQEVAHLARLHLTDAEAVKFAAQLAQVLGYIDKLEDVDTKGVEPLTHALDLAAPLRADEVRPSPGAEAMLAAAPDHLHENYKVPQVIGGGG